jgi:hypothetical protein
MIHTRTFKPSTKRPSKRTRPKRVRSRNVRRARRFGFTVAGLVAADNIVFASVAQAQWYNPVDWVTGGVGKVVAEVADAVFGGILKFIADLIAAAVTSATELLIAIFNNINVSVGPDGQMTGARTSAIQTEFIALGAGLVLLLFFARIISGLATGQMGKVARELFFDLPFTVIGTVAAGAIGYLILELTDQMAASLTADFATDIGTFAGKYFAADVLNTGGLFSFLFAILYILGAIALGAQLVVRAALLEVIFIVAPAMIATRTWEGSRRYSRRFIEISIGMMFGKPAAALALAVGAANLADADGVIGLLKGVTLVLLGAFMPFAVFKLIPLVEGAAVQQGITGAPIRAAQTALGTAASIAILKGGGAAAAAGNGAKGSTGSGGSGPGSGPGDGGSDGSPPSNPSPLSGHGGSGGANGPVVAGNVPPSPTKSTPKNAAPRDEQSTSDQQQGSGEGAGRNDAPVVASSSNGAARANRAANRAMNGATRSRSSTQSNPSSSSTSGSSSGASQEVVPVNTPATSSSPAPEPSSTSAPVVSLSPKSIPNFDTHDPASTPSTPPTPSPSSGGGSRRSSSRLRGANQALGSIRTVQADDLFGTRTDDEEERQGALR